tara:strand:- start:3949 stop:4359 length:411 start_codon:yes stop_codon:yes gene_type:complete
MKLPGFLKSKYVFYALATLAVLNVVGYVSVKAWECLVLFVLTAYSTQCYAKNKCASILAALFVANFVFGCGRLREGLENLTDGAEEKVEKAVDAADEAKKACEDECKKMDDTTEMEACIDACAEAKNKLEGAAAAL